MSEKGTVHQQNSTFGKSPVALLRDASISDGATRLYGYMHWRYGANKNNHEGRQSMADAMGRSKRTITKYLAELEQADWIVIIYRQSQQGRATSFYHVFESQEDCRQWRKDHKRPKAEREVIGRKGREGIGGKPSHKPKNDYVNSSSPSKQNANSGELKFSNPVNSSSDNPDSVDLDSIKDSTDAAKPVGTSPAGDENANGKTPPRKRTPAQQRLDAMKDAIADAFGLEHDNVTDAQWSEFGAAGKQLIKVGAQPEDMKPLHTWCSKQGWRSWSSIAMAKNWANFCKSRQPSNGAKATPTDATRAEAALYGGAS